MTDEAAKNLLFLIRYFFLTQEVTKYPCLYYKRHAEYKNASRKKYAWAKIHEEKNKPPCTSSHEWEVLLSRYSRKRMKYNSLNVSGAGRKKLAQAKKT